MVMHLVHELPPVTDREGNMYAARVVGAPAKDGLWDGAIELRDQDGQRFMTPVETRQSNLADLVYWSTGLSAVYVEGALTRALAAAAAIAAEAAGDRAVEALERGLRFRTATRRSATARRAPAAQRTATGGVARPGAGSGGGGRTPRSGTRTSRTSRTSGSSRTSTSRKTAGARAR